MSTIAADLLLTGRRISAVEAKRTFFMFFPLSSR